MTFMRCEEPLPDPDSVVPVHSDEQICRDRAYGWTCTREAGHPGDHQACGVAGKMHAWWRRHRPRQAPASTVRTIVAAVRADIRESMERELRRIGDRS